MSLPDPMLRHRATAFSLAGGCVATAPGWRTVAARRGPVVPLLAVFILIAPACQFAERWGSSGDLLVGRSGLRSAFDPPGPNPTGVSGVATHVPPLTEENRVEVTRISGVVGVRPAGERGTRTLEYYRPRVQTGPRGVVLTNPNATAEMAFSDDSRITLFHTNLVWIGDWQAGEPWVQCERLTSLQIKTSVESRLQSVELPGGSFLKMASRGLVRVALERDRYYQIRNEGETPAELTVSGHTSIIRPGDWVNLPVVRNAPTGGAPLEGAPEQGSTTPGPGSPGQSPVAAAAAAGTNIKYIKIGDAVFPDQNFKFSPVFYASKGSSQKSAVATDPNPNK